MIPSKSTAAFLLVLIIFSGVAVRPAHAVRCLNF